MKISYRIVVGLMMVFLLSVLTCCSGDAGKSLSDSSSFTSTETRDSTVTTTATTTTTASESDESSSEIESQSTASSTTIEDDNTTESTEIKVWISSKGKKYHNKSSCSNMNSPKQVTEKWAKENKYTPCKRCYK